MRTVIFDEVVDTDYGQFELVWSSEGDAFDGDFEKVFAGQTNGLVGAASGDGLYINLARRSGGSQVAIAVCAEKPSLDDEWEDVVEVSVTLPAGSEPHWLTWAGEESGPLDLPPGTYRVRVSARGRDAGAADEFAEAVVDWYLIEFWPAPEEADAIVRRTSADAEYWHRECGAPR